MVGSVVFQSFSTDDRYIIPLPHRSAANVHAFLSHSRKGQSESAWCEVLHCCRGILLRLTETFHLVKIKAKPLTICNIFNILYVVNFPSIVRNRDLRSAPVCRLPPKVQSTRQSYIHASGASDRSTIGDSYHVLSDRKVLRR